MKILKNTLLVAALTAGILCVGGIWFTTRAQNPTDSQDKRRPRRAESAPSPTPRPTRDDETILSSDDVVRVETNLTNVFFTAADRQKRFISNLRSEDVRI